MLEMVNASHDDEGDLPDYVELTQGEVEDFWPVWTVWRGTERQQLPMPGGLLDQPTSLMNTLLILDGLFEKVSMQVAKQRKDSNGQQH